MSPTVQVPFLDLGAQYEGLREEVLAVLRDVAESTCYVLGPKVASFEEKFAAYVGAEHCVAVNSGTSALHLALIAANVGANDEVITVPMTFVATTWAVRYVGAKPVFVDVDPNTYTLDVDHLKQAISPRTKAILPVHLYGQPADMQPIVDVAEAHGIPVIEDAAQAHGARYHDKPAGSLGMYGCFSFYPGKNLGAYGEGGAVVTNDKAVADRIRSLRDHAQATGQKGQHTELGFNYRMDAFQGAVLGVKLPHLETWTESRRHLAARYCQRLSGLPLQLPMEAEARRHVWHLFVVLSDRRDRIRSELQDRGIQSGLHYPIPVHLQPAFRDLGHQEGDFPVAERIGRECLTLPLFPEMSVHQQDLVVDALQEILY